MLFTAKCSQTRVNTGVTFGQDADVFSTFNTHTVVLMLGNDVLIIVMMCWCCVFKLTVVTKNMLSPT